MPTPFSVVTYFAPKGSSWLVMMVSSEVSFLSMPYSMQRALTFSPERGFTSAMSSARATVRAVMRLVWR